MKGLAAFGPYPGNMCEAEYRSNELICLEEEISRQDNTQAVH